MSLLLLYRPTRAAVETLASPEVTTADLERLRSLVQEAITNHTPRIEIGLSIEREVPRASPVAALLQQGGTPLATWLAVLLAAVTIILSLHEQDPAPRITPEQLEEIIKRAVEEAEAEPHRASERPRSGPPSSR